MSLESKQFYKPSDTEKTCSIFTDKFEKEASETLSSIGMKKEVSEGVLNYLIKKNKTILDDYKTPDKNYVELCSYIAIEIARLFIRAGKNPYIMMVNEKIIEDNFSNTKPLKPLVYGGRVTWYSHVICCFGNEVYDPIFGFPVNLEEYTEKLFGENINMEVIVEENGMLEFLSI